MITGYPFPKPLSHMRTCDDFDMCLSFTEPCPGTCPRAIRLKAAMNAPIVHPTFQNATNTQIVEEPMVRAEGCQSMFGKSCKWIVAAGIVIGSIAYWSYRYF